MGRFEAPHSFIASLVALVADATRRRFESRVDATLALLDASVAGRRS